MPAPHTIALFIISVLALNLTRGRAILFVLSHALGQGAAGSGGLGVWPRHRLGDPRRGGGFRARGAFDAIRLCAHQILRRWLSDLSRDHGFPRGRDRRAGRTGHRIPASVTRQGVSAGVLTDLLNPKLLLFFFSFLPQFVDSARGSPSLQMLVLGLLFQATGVPTNLMVALAGSSVARLLARNPFWAHVQRWLSSMILVGLWFRLALSEPMTDP